MSWSLGFIYFELSFDFLFHDATKPTGVSEIFWFLVLVSFVFCFFNQYLSPLFSEEEPKNHCVL